jgi:glycine/D-amino acid oxidase-like deaminating enzyme/nitrite reductase/ring-hydroxylating ferredoxin subunit
MNHSTWQSVRMPRFGKPKKSEHFDVVVVGGGITGLSAAYFLKKAGKTVAVVERDRLGAGDTSSTTAHLTAVTDLRLSELAKTFGDEATRLVWDGGSAAIDEIEAISKSNEIECGFQRVPGFLHASLRANRDEAARDETEEFKSEAELGERLGIPVEFVPAVPLVQKPGLRFADQAKFHPLTYLAGLARVVDGDGSRVFEHAEVSQVKADPLAVECGDIRLSCNYVVIATHVPLMGKTGIVSATFLQTKLYSYSSYAIGAKIPRGSLPEMSLWDTSDPYYYLRVDRRGNGDYVIFGGEDHKTGQVENTETCFDRLETQLHKLIPAAKVDRRWSGQVIETNDGLPFIGESAEQQFIATGFAGNGMTFGTLAGMMACDAALKRDNPWRELFAVNRTKVVGGTWEYLKENVDFPYRLVKDRVQGCDAETTRSVKRGEGKILDLDGQRVAAARDDDGKLHLVSAICTHLGCVVRWNQSERTWDCPCHGSRFDPSGKVIAGPAETALETIERKHEAPTG